MSIELPNLIILSSLTHSTQSLYHLNKTPIDFSPLPPPSVLLHNSSVITTSRFKLPEGWEVEEVPHANASPVDNAIETFSSTNETMPVETLGLVKDSGVKSRDQEVRSSVSPLKQSDLVQPEKSADAGVEGEPL